MQVQQNVLRKKLAFGRIAKINLSSVIFGTSVGILFAYWGAGVWSLVAKLLVTGIVQCLAYWRYNRWRPLWVFDWQSITGLLNFGSFMFFNSILNRLYYNVLSLIIGKCFSPMELGYYTQAGKLQDVPRNCISSAVINVTFPIFSGIQDDIARLKNAFSKCIRSIAFVYFPMAMILIIVARPLITVLFTSKWLPMIPYFQLLTVAGLLTTLFETHTNVIKSLGKSKGVFILEFVLRTIGLIIIVISIKFDMIGLLIGYTLSQFLFYIGASMYVGKLIHYDFRAQFGDLFLTLFIAVLPAIFVYLASSFFIVALVWQVIIQAFAYIAMYVLFSKLFKIKEFDFYCSKLKTLIIKKM